MSKFCAQVFLFGTSHLWLVPTSGLGAGTVLGLCSGEEDPTRQLCVVDNCWRYYENLYILISCISRIVHRIIVTTVFTSYKGCFKDNYPWVVCSRPNQRFQV